MRSKSTSLKMSGPFQKAFSILIPALVFSYHAAQAQCWQWATSAGGSNMETPTSLAVGPAGQLAITGEFMGTAVFGTYTLEATSGRDVFTVLMDSTGNIVNAMSGVGDGTANIGMGVAYDASGNVYLTGNFSGSITFGDVTLVADGSKDIFIVKYDATGNQVWVRQPTGPNELLVSDIAVDSEGNCHIMGSYYVSADFGDQTVISTSAQDVFTAKYDTDGNALWAVSCGYWGEDIGNGIAVDHAGNVYITGYFQTEFIFGGATFSSTGNRDGFLAKMDENGNALWAKTGGGSGNDFFNKVAVDAGGNNVYIIGDFESYTADIDGIFLTNTNQDVFRKDILLMNFDALGSSVWGISAGSAEHDFSYDVTADVNGDVYITGIYQDAITFGNTLLQNDDLFIALYDSTGNSLWATGSTYNTAGAESKSIAIYESRPVIAGDFAAGSAPPIAVFDNDTIISNGSFDVFLARIGPPCNEYVDVTGVRIQNFGDEVLDVYPNPFSSELHIGIKENSRSMKLSLYSSHGQLILSEQVGKVDKFTLRTGHLPAGIYFLHIESGDAIQSIKLVKGKD